MTFAKKSFGQHFLKDNSVIEKIIAAADPAAFPITVEVGPGTGALTEALAGVAQKLVLLEADRDLVPRLHERFPRAEIRVGDAAKADYGDIAPNGLWGLVGNLPYNAGNAILMHALMAKNPPEQAVIMVQKEVGERLLALPKSMSVLGVAVALYAIPERVCVVKPGAFTPPPKVDSMVVKLVKRSWQGADDRESVIGMAKAGFANRRKLLASNLGAAGYAPASWVGEWLQRHGYSEKARAEEIKVEDWVALYRDAQGIEHIARQG